MRLFEEITISLEVILLIAVGLIMLLLGVVLFPVATGALPSYEDGLYGLLLIMFGLQIQTVGKTPLGFVKRSWAALVPGIVITVIGFVTCFVPGILGRIPQYLVILLLGAGGILLLLQLFYAKDMYRLWKTAGGGIYTHLTLSCVSVYCLQVLIAALIGGQGFLPKALFYELLGILCLIFGLALFYLSVTLHRIYRLHPESDLSMHTRGIPLGTIMGMQFGFFMLVVGCLLVPVSLGLLPFAVSAQQGTMVLLLGVQALVAGSMMSFVFRRNLVILLVGLIFVAAGAFAILIPDLIATLLVIFIGLFNIVGGVYLLSVLLRSILKPGEPGTGPEGKDRRLLVLMLVLGVITAILMITFGLASLFQNLIPGTILGIILAGFGLSQFLTLYVQSVAGKSQVPGDGTE
jgi:hypothetical protein